MALTNCPECGKEVSSTAESCPNCGYGVKKHFDSVQRTIKKEEKHLRVCSWNKSKVFKIIIPACVLMLFIISAILFMVPHNKKYTKDDISLYDTQTKQYIRLGDSREQIEKLLGRPDEKHSSLAFPNEIDYTYDDYSLDLYFDDKGMLEMYKISTSLVATQPERLKIANEITISSNIDDFLKCYPDAQDDAPLGAYKRKRIYFSETEKELIVSDLNSGQFDVVADYNDKGFLRIYVRDNSD